MTSSSNTNTTGTGGTASSSRMKTKDFSYSWHLSLRVDRPLEGCTMRPHAYMYGKKLDGGGGGGGSGGGSGGSELFSSNESSSINIHSLQHQHHTKKMKEPPPQHEFVFRWFRGPLHELCANPQCIRRTSFSPHDWSKFALGGSNSCALQCVSTQSSLYKSTFCNAQCFIDAWKTQYTIPSNSGGGGGNNKNAAPIYGGGLGSRSATPNRSRSGSYAGSDDMLFDETASQQSSGSKSPSFYNDNSQPGTPRGYLHSYPNSSTGTTNSSSSNIPPPPPPPPPPPQHQHHRHVPSYANGVGELGEDWVEISRDHVYVPTELDVGHKLKIEASAYSLDSGELLMSRVVKTDVVLSRAPQPASRKMVLSNSSSSSSSNPKAIGARFRVVSYNVLAEIYATQQQYPYTDFWALSWEYRFQNMLREILDAGPDVLCLQEIQADHYENHVYGALSEAGYEGVYKQKTRQSMGLAGKVDGCGLFWRRSKFHLVESYSIEFNEVAQRQATNMLGLNPRSEEGMQFLNRLSKDNVAQLVVLEFIQSSLGRATQQRELTVNQVCIANTHLYSNKDFPDVKLWQAWQLLQELEQFIVSRGTNLPLIICGDFNSTPDTAVYDLLSRQSVHPGHPDVNVATNEDVPNVLPDAMGITHSFQLGSAYQTVLGDEPWVTNYTQNFKGCLDYIWYSATNLRPLSVAPIPDETEITKCGEAMPNTELSSDHIMMIADIQVVGNAR